jgi:hypothetical protein
MKAFRVSCPEGTDDNSLAFIAGKQNLPPHLQSRTGRLKTDDGDVDNVPFSFVPSGLMRLSWNIFPRDKSLGYFQFVPSGQKKCITMTRSK